MASQTEKLDDRSGFVDPYKEEIAFYVTFHAIFVIANKRVGTVLLRNSPFLL